MKTKHGQLASEGDVSEKERFFWSLAQGVAALLEGEHDFLANMANVAALLFEELPDVNWAGFYLLKGQDLVLGPFQGKPACTRIAPGKGVCGTAAESAKPSWWKTSASFPDILPAILDRTRRSLYRWSETAI